MRFDYYLVGTGWARAELDSGATVVELSASYLSDALGDLLRAVLELLDGEPETRCSWYIEPGEFRWLLTRSEDLVCLRILRFPDLWDGRPDAEGREVFSVLELMPILAATIADGAARTLEREGAESYLHAWVEHPFPLATLSTILDRLRDSDIPSGPHL